jgi:hypothetical protein
MTIIAPWVLDEDNTLPYVTIQDVKNSAIAASLDFTNLVPNTGVNSQDAALSQLIYQASAKVDAYAAGALSKLSATVNTENGRSSINRRGQFIIHPYGWPVLELRSFSYAAQGPTGGMTQIPLTNNNTQIERYEFIVNTNWNPGQSAFYQFGTSMFPGAQYGNEYACEYVYVNGFPNTMNEVPIVKGDTSVHVTTNVGIYPGSALIIWDGANTETVHVSMDYVPDTTNDIILSAPCKFSHVAGVSLASPNLTAVKEATIHFVVAMVEERGSGSFTLSGASAAGPGAPMTSIEQHHAAGYDLLDTFRNIWGRV